MINSQTATRSSIQDYLELTKPKVVLLMLLTSAVGMLLDSPPNVLPVKALVLGNLGIALCAGSAAIINHLVDRQIDLRMKRTQQRPVAQGRVTSSKALGLSLLLGIMGLSILIVFINTLTAWLSLATLLGYAVIYTLFLKHATPQNIVIGGLAGAAPPLLGWTSVTGTIDPNALLLVLVIFAWTPPHFWALAVYRCEEYRNAKVPMLPVTHGIPFTKLSIVLYTVLLILCTLLPFLTGMSGWIYLISAVCLGLIFLGYAFKMYFDSSPKIALHTFLYSIFYLMGLFISLLLDHYVVFWL